MNSPRGIRDSGTGGVRAIEDLWDARGGLRNLGNCRLGMCDAAVVVEEHVHVLVQKIRAQTFKVFWEIFAGCAIMTSCFEAAAWQCGPPIDIEDDPSYNVLNPLFLCVVLGLILEGRIAVLHWGPPCSSFSWALE